jgi:ribosomal protein S18 acetylase RimI-like enzyme
MEIRPFEDADEDAVVALWGRCSLTRPWNDPHKDIARKRRVQRELFLVGVVDGSIVGSVMAGYEGHRGWVNYLAVDPAHRRRGLGRALMAAVEMQLRALDCPKINLQIRHDNAEARSFYESLGFSVDASISYGKRLEQDEIDRRPTS